MGRLANWLSSNRRSRIFLIAGTLLLPLINLFSGAVVAMTAATLGWRVAVTDCLAGVGILIALLALSGGPWDSAVVGALTMWAGALLGGHLLGRTGSFDLAVQLLVAVAVVAVFAISLFLPAGVAARVVYDGRENGIRLDERFDLVNISDDDDEGVYQTDGYDQAADRVLFVIDGGNAPVTITTEGGR